MWDLAESTIAAELSPEEKLLWAGRPPRGLMLNSSDLFLIPFLLAWTGTIIAGTADALVGGAPIAMLVFPSLFVFIGVYGLFARFIIDVQQRKRTFYGVTTERIIIVSGFFTRKVKSINLQTLTDLSLSERKGGAGVITFGPLVPHKDWFSQNSFRRLGYPPLPCLELPSETKEVYTIVLLAQRAARQHD